MRTYLILFTLLALCSANQQHKSEKPEKHRKSYVCPPNFMRLSNKCYYFSNKTATWQNAYWKCRDMHSNIAIIKNGNQDRILRKTLDHDGLVPLERWIGGRYDWGTMSWKWGTSGRAVVYEGFGDPGMLKRNDGFSWHCIVMDPKKHYKWNSKPCIDEKHYICQTKLRIVSNRDKKKLQKIYNSKLNEVAVPEIRTNETAYLKHYPLKSAAFAKRPKEERRSGRKKKKDTLALTQKTDKAARQAAKLERAARRRNARERRLKRKEQSKHNHNITDIMYKTYYAATKSPLHPRIAVEEFSYS